MSITVQIERFIDIAPELVPLFLRHWDELALYKDKKPLAPQYDEYLRREMNGTLFVVTVRRDGRIAAYYIGQIALGFHYGLTLIGHMDIAYVVPEARGRGLCLPLFRAVEREFRRRGAKLWVSGWKTAKPLGMDRLHELLGFEPGDTYVMKWIGAS